MKDLFGDGQGGGGRIEAAFDAARRRGEACFVPFLNYGDPEPALTLPLLRALEAAGADLIELGIPFSDPMADGPVLQRSAERALAAGATLRGALDVVSEFRRSSEVPVILFGYTNPYFRYGFDALARDARAAGADGFLAVDLPPEEATDFDRAAKAQGLDLIYLLAPTSTLGRMRTVLARARGFVYFVSVTGVTGARTELAGNLEELVRSVRRHTELPVGVGFGISTPQQAGHVATFADAVILGSAIAAVLEAPPRSDVVDRVGRFAKSLKEAVRSSRRVQETA